MKKKIEEKSSKFWRKFWEHFEVVFRAEGAFSVVAQIPEVGFQVCPEYLSIAIAISLSLEHISVALWDPTDFSHPPTIILFGASFAIY